MKNTVDMVLKLWQTSERGELGALVPDLEIIRLVYERLPVPQMWLNLAI
jgi:hypothetical protein